MPENLDWFKNYKELEDKVLETNQTLEKLYKKRDVLKRDIVLERYEFELNTIGGFQKEKV